MQLAMLSTTFEKSMGLLGLMSDCVRYLTKGIVCYHLIKYGDWLFLNAILACNSNKEEVL